MYMIKTLSAGCLVLLLCGCESWCDRNKPAPTAPIAEVPQNKPSEYTIKDAVELMTQRLSFFFSMHAMAGAPDVFLANDSRTPAAFKLYTALLEAKIIRRGSSDAVYQLSSVQMGSVWKINVLENGKPVFSRSVVLKQETVR